MQRLCGIDQTMCRLVLDALVRAKFLSLKSDGTYSSVDGGQFASFAPGEGGADIDDADRDDSAPCELQVLCGRSRISTPHAPANRVA